MTVPSSSVDQTPPSILIVEDDVLIRLHAVDIASDSGFRVYEASNADEAIRILEKRQDIRIVFTDIEMPGSMDGLKLAHYVRHRWPPIKLIIASGKLRPQLHDLPEGGMFFPKPYNPTEIAAALHSLAA